MLSCIPCCHAITCFNERTEDSASAIPDIFRKEAYVQCYQPVIYPTNGLNLWEETPYPDILPMIKKMPGRPKKSRNRATDEKRTEGQKNRDPSLVSRKGKANKCSICKKSGHKKGSCKEKHLQPQTSTHPATSSQPTKTSTRSNKKAKSASASNSTRSKMQPRKAKF